MNRLDVSNQQRIQAMQQKAQLQRITEETSDFATTMNHDTNRNIIATESTIGANELLTLQHLGSSSDKS